MGAVKQFDSLSTSYVNLAALIRQLREQKFVGLIHVVLPEYEAEVRLNGQGQTSVSEIDMATRRPSQTDGALERLLVHAREPGGTITVFESRAGHEPDIHGQARSTAHAAEDDDEVTETSAFEAQFPSATAPLAEAVDWDDLLDAGGKLIGAVERAIRDVGADFDSTFRAARIELGDDYPFLDPTAGSLTYADKAITLSGRPGGKTFVVGVSECLRRIVNKLAIGKEAKRFRESIAVELASAARMRPNGLGEFTPQLDRIAGTRVL